MVQFRFLFTAIMQTDFMICCGFLFQDIIIIWDEMIKILHVKEHY